MIEEVRVDADEAGFVLVLVGDLTEAARRHLRDEASTGMALRLSPDAAIELLAQARSVVGPWVAEMDTERRAYDAASPEERARVLGLIDHEDDSGYDSDEPKHPGWSVRVPDAADLARKRAKETR